MIVGSHFDSETNKQSQLKRSEFSESQDYPSPHTSRDGILECIQTDATIQLPRLPNMHLQQTRFGEIIPEHAQSFNGFRARMKGPTDYSFWVVCLIWRECRQSVQSLCQRLTLFSQLPQFVCAG